MHMYSYLSVNNPPTGLSFILLPIACYMKLEFICAHDMMNSIFSKKKNDILMPLSIEGFTKAFM